MPVFWGMVSWDIMEIFILFFVFLKLVVLFSLDKAEI